MDMSLAGDTKALDVPIASTVLTAAAQYTCLNLIQTGAGFYNRLGNRIILKSLEIKLALEPSNVVNQGYDATWVRILFVYDRQTNGANPGASDVLQDTLQDGTNVATAYSGINLGNSRRFTVIRDYQIECPDFTTDANGFATASVIDQQNFKTKIHDFSTKVKGMVTMYKAASNPAVVGDIATGGLFMMTCIAGAANSWSIEGKMRLRFDDPQ